MGVEARCIQIKGGVRSKGMCGARGGVGSGKRCV